jgi:NADH-quinone oxidoreductase subunit F
MKMDYSHIDSLIAQYGKEKRAVIPLLQGIQSQYNYLPQTALQYIADKTSITPADIYGIASFYSQFKLEAVGENIIKVCVGTACHVKGASLVHEAFKRELKLEKGQNTNAQGSYTLEKVACLGCCTIAPVVQINDITYGYVSSEQAAEIIADFESQKGKKGQRAYRKSNGEAIQGEIRIGLGSCCVASGSEEVKQALQTHIQEQALPVDLKQVGCVGMCHQVPLVEIIKGDSQQLYTQVKPEEVHEIVRQHFRPTGFWKRLKSQFSQGIAYLQFDEANESLSRYDDTVREKHIQSFLGDQLAIATEYRGVLNPLDLDEYKHLGGFKALEKALAMSPQAIIHEVKNSGLRGRGGAGFPSHRKWQLMMEQKGPVKYLICNGDEGDPGAFMDRMLLESYPYRIIEGILIAAYATGATQGYFYIRAEYPLAVQRVKKALEYMETAALLGKNILNSGFDFNLDIVQGAGAFVCGEETALLASIEGKRGFPKLRPPYPVEHGLWGYPSLVNNTETYAQVPHIINKGSEYFASIGTENSKGTKVFSLAGKVKRGGLIEVPMGMSISRIVNETGGGVHDGRSFKAVQIGGPSGGCIPHWLADTKIDYESLQNHGAMMGSGGMVVLDNTDCMVDIARYFLSFTQQESCGKCTFCRVGTRRMLDILNQISEGKGKIGDIEELENLGKMVSKGSICGLGKTAPNPVLSTLKYFRDEYEAHIKGNCPAGKCTSLISYVIQDKCIGCTLCAQKCPADAIPFTPYQKHEINQDLCIKCDACKQVCPEDAIEII